MKGRPVAYDEFLETLPDYEDKLNELNPLSDAMLTDISNRETRVSIVAFAEQMANAPFKNIH